MKRREVYRMGKKYQIPGHALYMSLIHVGMCLHICVFHNGPGGVMDPKAVMQGVAVRCKGQD